MRRPLTLRRRLVLGIIALLAAVTLVIGVLGVLALQGFLVGRVDSQLNDAARRSQQALDGPIDRDDVGRPPDRPPASEFLAIPGQAQGTLAAIESSGNVYNGAVLSQSGAPVPLTAAQLALLESVPQDGKPHTVDLGPGLDNYRIYVAPAQPSGDSLVIGLPLGEVQLTVLRLALLILVIGGIGVIAAALVGAFVVRLALRPLERVAATATRVSELPLDRGEVALAVRVAPEDADPATEVGSVGASFNRMLEHVASALTARQASENKVRTFVADASHELRTPLASIRGYAELTRRGGHDLPADVVHALARVESESVRMTALVEELLLLARLDEGAAIEHEPVDLTRLVIDAVSDATVAGPEHTWHMNLPDEPVVVKGDQARLHQIIANLLANARTHTPAGTMVTAALRTSATEAVIEVRDTGPGIPEGILPTVFERFVRGDGSRARASGGTGLGLAIVAAAAQAHEGRAEVSSTPGATVFTVTLPLPLD